eukprot:2690827-Rhodomonas_salina.1
MVVGSVSGLFLDLPFVLSPLSAIKAEEVDNLVSQCVQPAPPLGVGGHPGHELALHEGLGVEQLAAGEATLGEDAHCVAALCDPAVEFLGCDVHARAGDAVGVEGVAPAVHVPALRELAAGVEGVEAKGLEDVVVPRGVEAHLQQAFEHPAQHAVLCVPHWHVAPPHARRELFLVHTCPHPTATPLSAAWPVCNAEIQEGTRAAAARPAR